MKFIARVFSASALALLIAAGECLAAPGTPAEEYAALLQEYNAVSGGMRLAKTDLQRNEAVARLSAFPVRFVELAEKFPEDPIALVALKQAIQAVGSTDSAAQIAWESNDSNFPADRTDNATGKIVGLLRRDHLQSDKLGPVCDRMRYGYRMEFETFLSAVLMENPHRDVQAEACLSLAQFLYDRLRMLQLADDRPELIRRYESVFGKNYLPELQRLGQAALSRRIEALLERAAKDYGDVKDRNGGTIGAQAKLGLHELRHLAIGKVAPDIEGQDQNGEHFKLSDYRGNVVLLYFWSEY